MIRSRSSLRREKSTLGMGVGIGVGAFGGGYLASRMNKENDVAAINLKSELEKSYTNEQKEIKLQADKLDAYLSHHIQLAQNIAAADAMNLYQIHNPYRTAAPNTIINVNSNSGPTLGMSPEERREQRAQEMEDLIRNEKEAKSREDKNKIEWSNGLSAARNRGSLIGGSKFKLANSAEYSKLSMLREKYANSITPSQKALVSRLSKLSSSSTWTSVFGVTLGAVIGGIAGNHLGAASVERRFSAKEIFTKIFK